MELITNSTTRRESTTLDPTKPMEVLMKQGDVMSNTENRRKFFERCRADRPWPCRRDHDWRQVGAA